MDIKKIMEEYDDKNIIFDLGNVLIKYDPFSFIKQNIKVENQENFYNIVFKGEEWEALDRGTITSNGSNNSFK